MLPIQDEVQPQNSKMHANATASPTLAPIDTFRRPWTMFNRTPPIDISETRMNNNVGSAQSSHENGFLNVGNNELGFNTQNSTRYEHLNENKCNPKRAEETVHKTQVNSLRNSIEHVSNMLPHTFSDCSRSSSPTFYIFPGTAIETSRTDRNLEKPHPTDNVEQTCKKRRLSGTQNQMAEISQNQMVPELRTFYNDHINTFPVSYSNPQNNASYSETGYKSPETSCPRPVYYSPPHYVPLYPPPMLHGLAVSDSQQIPQAPDSKTTYLTPSRQTPIMSTNQTLNNRTKKVCQRRLSSPADFEKSGDRSCDEGNVISEITLKIQSTLFIHCKFLIIREEFIIASFH
jgi:hypothetical protein